MFKITLLFLLVSLASHSADYPKSEIEFVYKLINDAKKFSPRDDIKDEDITSGLLKGGLEKIDPHSTYFTKEENAKLVESLSGSFSGIGTHIDIHQGVVRVVAVIKGMPAEKAGMQNGDYITHIDGKSTFGMNLEEASSMLKGKKGTKVKVEVFRKDMEKISEKPLEFEIVRNTIEIDTVTAKKVDNILIVTISVFNEKTFDEFFKIMQKQKDYMGVILDLRSNPGGILESALAISSMFLEKDSVIVQTSNVEQMKQESEAQCVGSIKNCRKIRYSILNNKIAISNDDYPLIPSNIPVAVLVNGYSASASEITSLALQENFRAIVIGQKTFGKGSVQKIMPISGDRGAVKFTTSLYYSPKGNSIQADGVQPDVALPEMQVKKQEKIKDFFPRKESSYKNYIKVKTENQENLTEEKSQEVLEASAVEDFSLQAAITSIKTSIKHHGYKD